MEVVLADGTACCARGQRAFRNVDKPFYRTCGPGPHRPLHARLGQLRHQGRGDVSADSRLPTFTGYASFVFDGMGRRALRSRRWRGPVRRRRPTVFDPESTRANLRSEGLLNDAGMLLKVMRNEGSFVQGLLAGWSPAGGRSIILAQRRLLAAPGLHGTQRGRLAGRPGACREACTAHGGAEIADSIPRAVRANPFPPPDGVLGGDGHRWAALNAKVAHSDAPRIMAASCRGARAIPRAHAVRGRVDDTPVDRHRHHGVQFRAGLPLARRMAAHP
jgi:hypothetical protein